MNVAAIMNPVATRASITFGDDDEYVDPIYYLGAVDPLALLIWWSNDKATWGDNECAPDNNTLIQRLIAIGEQGAGAYDKLLPGMVSGLPAEYVAEAKRTRKYFINKFVQMGIKDEGPISKTRTDMFAILTDTSKLKLKDMALLSRIHDFYVEDQFVERMIEDAVSVDSNVFPDAYHINQVYTVLGNNRHITVRSKDNVWWMKGKDKTLLMLTSPTHLSTNSLVEQMLAPKRR